MIQDVRFTLRRLIRSRLYTTAIVAMLAMGIGTTAATLNVLYALAWEPIDIPDRDTLVAVSSVNARGVERPLPLSTLTFLAQARLTASPWCGYNAITETTDAGTGPIDSYVALLSANCPRVLGVEPILGRWFQPGEVRLSGSSDGLAVISHHYWRRAFAAHPEVIGRTIHVHNAALTVVGVLPATFRGLSRDYDTDLFVPVNAHRPASTALTFITRLDPGDSAESLGTRAAFVWPALLESVLRPGPALQQALKETRPWARPAANGFSRLRNLYASQARALAGLSTALLVLMCLSVGSLFVARWMRRGPEAVTMRALGASRWRVARLMLAEALVLAVLGSALALPLAHIAGRSVAGLLPVDVLPLALEFGLNRVVTSGVLAGSLGLAPLISAWPIWRMARRTSFWEPQERAVARATSLGERILLVGQVAIALALLFSTALIVRSLDALWRVDRGFNGDRVLSARLFPNPGAYQTLDQAAYYPELLRRLGSLPGVRSVGAARYFSTIDVVLTGGQPLSFDGHEPATTAFLEYISPGFLGTLGIPILHGRDVAWNDAQDAVPVALVSESLARTLSSNAAGLLGRTLRFGTGPNAVRLTVVGVVGNISLGTPRQADHRVIYRSGVQAGQATMSTVHLRTDGPPMDLARSVADTVESFGYEHVVGPYELDHLFSNSLLAERMGAFIGLMHAVLALLIACLGLYAAMAQSVAARTRELGVRIALGARPLSVWRAVVGAGAMVVLAGIVLGYPLAVAAASSVRSLFYGLESTDAFGFAGCATLLLLSGTVAAGIPAWRATRIDPAATLRQP